MIRTQAYRFELKPNNKQQTLLAKHVGTARYAYNWALARRIELFEKNEGPARFTNAIVDHREWNMWKKDGAPWWVEVSKCCAQEAFRDLDTAFKNFRQGRKAGRNVGFPKFKKKGCRDSCRFSTGAIRALGQHVQLPRLGRIRVKEMTAVKGRILSATVSREADRWYVSFTVEREWDIPKTPVGTAIGIDLGILSFAVLSDGERLSSPRALERGHKRLRRLQKKHSRKQRGSSNRRKSAMRIAILHRHIRNQRRDFLHKETTKLAKTKRAIVVEDLAVKDMSRSARGTLEKPGKNVRAKSGLNRAILDQGWGEFRRMLEYKTPWYGSQLIVAPKFYPSSKRCSACGFVVAHLPLRIRQWSCPSCNASHDRDLNAAINLEQLTTASSAGRYACGDFSGGGTALAPVYEPRVEETGSEWQVSRHEIFA